MPVRVPAAKVLMSSSAPLAFSMATPNILYNNAVNTHAHPMVNIDILGTKHLVHGLARVKKKRRKGRSAHQQSPECWPRMHLVWSPC